MGRMNAVHRSPQLSLDFEAPSPIREPATSGSSVTALAPVRAGPAAGIALLHSQDDLGVIETWNGARCDDVHGAVQGQAQTRAGHTARSYRREARRFVL